MGKAKISREVTEKDVSCLENFVVAYNTVFLMSSIFIVSLAGTANELFSELHRLLSPSILLLIVGGFIVLISGLGYVGVAKKSSTMISMYTLLLILVFVMEVSAGLGILSFRGEIKSTIACKIKRAMYTYPEDAMTANLVDYVQLQLRCCGIDSYEDWGGIDVVQSNCLFEKYTLPDSCCRKINSTLKVINTRGCLPSLNFMLHKSSLLLSTTITAICTIQILGAYFAYSLSSTLNKLKVQKLMNSNASQNKVEASPPRYEEKNNYF